MKIPKYMTMAFFIVGIVCTAIAAILQNIESDKTSNQIIALQDKLIKYSTGGDELPAVAVLTGRDQIALSIVTRDTFPLVNVKVKCQEHTLPDVGTIYPQVTTTFFTDTISKTADSVLYDLVIWYNNTKSLRANVIIKRRQDGFFDNRVEYLNSKGEPFEHPYQGKPSMRTNDSSPNVYRPEMHH